MSTINIGIVGYGNLGRGVETELKKNEDMKLVGIFTRRDLKSIKTVNDNIKVIRFDEIFNYSNKIDVMILCGGSAKDLKYQSPLIAKNFNIVDSFDTHARINEHLEKVNSSSKNGGKIAIVSIGWDPGIFSAIRLISESVLPNGNTYTFWGRGVSQGHSDAIRKIDGVKDAIQYTVPIDEAIEKVRRCENPILNTTDKHIRECFVVAREDYNKEEIREKIINMPYYFKGYNTIVNFVTEEELILYKKSMSHRGLVFRNGVTGEEEQYNNSIELSLKLDNNPSFTASVLIAYARAAYRLNKEGQTGAKTIFDVPISYITKISPKDYIDRLL